MKERLQSGRALSSRQTGRRAHDCGRRGSRVRTVGWRGGRHSIGGSHSPAWLGTLIESILRSSPDNRRRCASERFAGAGRLDGLSARPPHRRHSAARPAGRSLGGDCDLLVTRRAASRRTRRNCDVDVTSESNRGAGPLKRRKPHLRRGGGSKKITGDASD